MSRGDESDSGRASGLTESLDLDALAAAYERGDRTPRDVVAAVRAHVDARGQDGVWISLTATEALEEAATAVEARRRAGEALPLYGVPFAVKDNIDVAGLPTTAACAEYSYMPQRSAPVVARLVQAGAIVVGKTNLDQFATGLVGVRSPYGIPRNPFRGDYITGGSSSGSAVSVAVGEVSFALGTDTAGSGRIPAAFNNIVGLKPSRGVLSATGVVPACRSLDCVSIFANSCEDAARVADAARGFDASDPFSNPGASSVAFQPEATPAQFRFGVPAAGHRQFQGDGDAAAAFDAAQAACKALGGSPVEIDMEPFFAAGALLYEGPFVAERLEAAGELFTRSPEVLLPPLRAILTQATQHDARAAFAALTQLRLLRRRVTALWASMDFLLLPTAPTFPTIAAVEEDPLRTNAALGIYTTFANLLDLAAVAVPSFFRSDGLPAGVTLLGPWGSDARLAGFGSRVHRASSSTMGNTGLPLPRSAGGAATAAPGSAAPTVPAQAAITAPTSGATTPASSPSDELTIVVLGAHLSGQPLNHQLTSAGGRLARSCATAPRYRLFALPDTAPPKPGLVRVDDPDSGAAIEVEVWSLPAAAFGTFVSRVPAPLCIGKVELEDGSLVSGFLCEAHATTGARDISAFGGWRAYRSSQEPWEGS